MSLKKGTLEDVFIELTEAVPAEAVTEESAFDKSEVDKA